MRSLLRFDAAFSIFDDPTQPRENYRPPTRDFYVPDNRSTQYSPKIGPWSLSQSTLRSGAAPRVSKKARNSLDQRTATNVTITTGLLIHLVAWDEPGAVLPPTVLASWPRSGWVWLFPVMGAGVILMLVNWLWAKRLERLRNVRFRKQLAEHTRTARDLQDTLLQTIEASRMIAEDALDPPADPVRMRRAMSRISDWLGQATAEGQAALDSLRIATPEESDSTATSWSRWLRKLWRCLWRDRMSDLYRP